MKKYGKRFKKNLYIYQEIVELTTSAKIKLDA